MILLEFKAYGKASQFSAVDEALRTVQFIRNKAIRFWMDGLGKSQYDLNKYCAVLAKEFPFVAELNSMARQASAERAWSAIARFYDNCKKREFGLRKGQQILVKGNRGFLGLVAIGNQSANNIDQAIDGRAVPRMLNLRNVLQLVNNGFNDGALPQ